MIFIGMLLTLTFTVSYHTLIKRYPHKTELFGTISFIAILCVTIIAWETAYNLAKTGSTYKEKLISENIVEQKINGSYFYYELSLEKSVIYVVPKGTHGMRITTLPYSGDIKEVHVEESPRVEYKERYKEHRYSEWLTWPFGVRMLDKVEHKDVTFYIPET